MTLLWKQWQKKYYNELETCSNFAISGLYSAFKRTLNYIYKLTYYYHEI